MLLGDMLRVFELNVKNLQIRSDFFEELTFTPGVNKML